jgi:hypothetical protein
LNINPGVNAFASKESKLSPVPQGPCTGAAGLPEELEVAVCGVEVIVHRTVSPAETFVTASTIIPPVIVVLQSTNPISPGIWPPQGAAASPILTSKVAAWAETHVMDNSRAKTLKNK